MSPAETGEPAVLHPTDQQERNTALVLTALELLTGSASTDFVDDLFSPDYVDHNAPGASNPAWVARTAVRLRTAFPDFAHVVEDTVAQGDLVALRSTMTGTHDGDFVGPDFVLPPTGKPIRVRHFHMFRVSEGRIVEHWALRDDLGMQRQLGLLPTPASKEKN
jgi:predicted ester cyclase